MRVKNTETFPKKKKTKGANMLANDIKIQSTKGYFRFSGKCERTF